MSDASSDELPLDYDRRGRGDSGNTLPYALERELEKNEEQIVSARNSPMWPGLEAIAHTLAYDAACLGNGLPSENDFAAVYSIAFVSESRGCPFPRPPFVLGATIPRRRKP
jgi:hypothetical protein